MTLTGVTGPAGTEGENQWYTPYLPVFTFYLAIRNPLVLTSQQHRVRAKGPLKWKDIVSPNTRRNNKETQRMRQPPTPPHLQHPSFPYITEVNEMCEEEFRILL